MSILERYYGTIEELTLRLDENELALRLGTERGYTHDAVVNYTRLVREAMTAKYAAARVDVTRADENVLDLGFGRFTSRSLSKALGECVGQLDYYTTIIFACQYIFSIFSKKFFNSLL